jgi:hypothetical protein
MRKIITYILLIIFSFGVVGFVFNYLLAFGNLSYNNELPLYEIQDIQEKNDEIFIGLVFYNRIQVYDLKGDYKRHIKTNNYSKNYTFYVNDFGKPILGQNSDVENNKMDFIQSRTTKYHIKSTYPVIIEKVNTKSKDIIVQPFYMMLWSGPIIPWGISAISMILFILVNLQIVLKVFADPEPISKLKKLILVIKKTL